MPYQNENKLHSIFLQAPAAIAILEGPDQIFVLANEKYLKLYKRTWSEVDGKTLLEVFPELEKQGINELFKMVYTTGETFAADEFPSEWHTENGEKVKRFFNIVIQPIRNDEGKITSVMLHSYEVTQQVKANLRIKENEERYNTMLLHSPFAFAVLKGKDFVINFANDAMKEIWRRKDVEGLKLLEFRPDLKEQQFPALLKEVMDTGKPFHGYEMRVTFLRNDKTEEGYFNFVYQPYREADDIITGVTIIAVEVTAQIAAKKNIAENEKRFRSMVQNAPVAICVLRSEKFIVEIANEKMLEIWGKTAEELMNKPVFEAMPDAKGQGFETLLDGVYNTGKPFIANELPLTLLRNGTMENIFVSFVYEPWYDDNRTIIGIIAVATDITEQVASRKRIEDSENRFANMIYSSPLIITILEGENFVMKIANDSILEHLGKGRNIIGKPYLEANPELEEQGVGNIIREVYRTGVPFQTFNTPVYLIRNGVKHELYYNYLIQAQRKANGEIEGIAITATEVTESVELGMKIKESEEKFRLLADFMPQQVWTADIEGNLDYYNQSVMDYSGLSLEQINTLGWLDIVHPDDRPENIKLWMESISTGKDFIYEHRFRRNDGEYRWQLSRAIPQKDENGKIQRWVGTSTDIEEQKNFTAQLEKQVWERTQELKKSEERYHLMVEEVQDYAILFLNEHGVVENWNKGAEKIKGYKDEEIIGKSFTTFYTSHDNENNLPQQLLDIAKKQGKAVHEGWRVRKDGTLFWASVVITAVHNEANDIVGFSKVTHDLTEKKKADDELKVQSDILKQKNADLIKMNEELASFTYVSSHDLQEPLRKIQLFCDRIKQKEIQTLSEEGKNYFDRMESAAHRMQSLINDLLSYSRANDKTRKLELTKLNKIVDDVKIELQERIEEKNAVIEVSDLPEIMMIPFQMRQLMHNLISNSLKFSKTGVAPHIKISCTIKSHDQLSIANLPPYKNFYQIAVSDNGIGFNAEYNEKIFGVFQRLHERDIYEGTGIGLAIVRKVVQNHQGVITAYGNENEGATFNIYLPVN